MAFRTKIVNIVKGIHHFYTNLSSNQVEFIVKKIVSISKRTDATKSNEDTKRIVAAELNNKPAATMTWTETRSIQVSSLKEQMTKVNEIESKTKR